MQLRTLAAAMAFAAGLLVPAAASASYTTGSVNLRSGPGTNYRVIASAPPGAYVAVRSCVPRWCRVSYRGITGWMSSGYIARTPRAVGPRVYAPRPYVYAPRPYVYPRTYYPRAYYPRPYYWGGGPSVFFYYNDRDDHRPAKPKPPKKKPGRK